MRCVDAMERRRANIKYRRHDSSIPLEATRDKRLHSRHCWQPVEGSRSEHSEKQRLTCGRRHAQLTCTQDGDVSRTERRRRQRQRQLRRLQWGATLLIMVGEFAASEKNSAVCIDTREEVQKQGTKRPVLRERATQRLRNLLERWALRVRVTTWGILRTWTAVKQRAMCTLRGQEKRRMSMLCRLLAWRTLMMSITRASRMQNIPQMTVLRSLMAQMVAKMSTRNGASWRRGASTLALSLTLMTMLTDWYELMNNERTIAVKALCLSLLLYGEHKNTEWACERLWRILRRSLQCWQKGERMLHHGAALVAITAMSESVEHPVWHVARRSRVSWLGHKVECAVRKLSEGRQRHWRLCDAGNVN